MAKGLRRGGYCMNLGSGLRFGEWLSDWGVFFFNLDIKNLCRQSVSYTNIKTANKCEMPGLIL